MSSVPYEMLPPFFQSSRAKGNGVISAIHFCLISSWTSKDLNLYFLIPTTTVLVHGFIYSSLAVTIASKFLIYFF